VGKQDKPSIFFEPTSDLQSPNDYSVVLVGISLFEVFQQTPYRFASGREDGQADHDEKESLKDGEEKAKDPQPNEDPTDDQKSNLLQFVHGSVSVDIIIRGGQNQANPFPLP
jgi:hypothetical protein